MQVHPNGFFSDKLLATFDSIHKGKLTDDSIEYQNEVVKPFTILCNSISNILLPSSREKTNFVNSYFDLFFPEIGYVINYKIDEECVSFYINLDDTSLYFGLIIETEEADKIYLYPNHASIFLKNYGFHGKKSKVNDFLYHNTNDYIIFHNCNILLGYLFNTENTEIIQFTNIIYDLIESNYYSSCSFETVILTKDFLNKSKETLINIVIDIFDSFYRATSELLFQNSLLEISEQFTYYTINRRLEKYADATYIEKSQLETWIKSITRKKQAIFYGSPGTGKTFIAENIAQYLIGGGDGFYELIQFHPAYSYEDFIQGIRPQTDSGQLSYNLLPGRFIEFCNKAAECKDKCVLIIDEINRANLAEVFGELMYLLEYREQEICLAGSQEKFKIPDNVYLIGTMNTADRSIALVDFALRRRFAFIKIAPNYDIITKFHQQHTELEVTGLIAVLKKINKLIDDENYYLGVSFFLTKTLAEDIEDIWQMEIEPYLEEYFCDNLEEIQQYQWKNIKDQISPKILNNNAPS